jgi:hypothetical protein
MFKGNNQTTYVETQFTHRQIGCPAKAMMQEVAELSGNFCRELSVHETGEGILAFFFCVKKYETHGSVCNDIS